MLNEIHAGLKTIAHCKISNKSFINSPVKEKAKTYKLSFGRISESDGDISVQGLLIKQRCTKPKCWHEICYMGKVSTSYLQYYNHAKYCTISTKIKQKI